MGAHHIYVYICIIIFQKRHWCEKSLQKKKKGHFAHIGNEIKICSQNKCHHHLSNVCENSFRMLHSNWVISDYHSFVWAVLLDPAREIQTAKQMNGNQKWTNYCETYEMNVHRRWKGDDGIYFGYRFWFHCLYVTRSDEMGLKLHHTVPSISLKTVVGVSLGEIEIFALCRSSVIFTPYTCSFLIVFDP